MVLSLLVTCINVQASANQPRVVCEQQYDFGRRNNEETVDHAFVIANAGEGPLVISNIHACCGSTAQLTRNSIPPGSNAVLTVGFILKGRKGPQTKVYYFSSNDPDAAITQLKLIGIAVPAVDIVPERIDFGQISNIGSIQTQVVIICQSNVIFRITNIVCSITNLAVECPEPFTSNQCRLLVRTLSPLPTMKLEGKIQFFTDHPEHSRMEIPITGRVIGEIAVTPNEIAVMAQGDNAVPVMRYVSVHSSRPFKILNAACSETNITVKVDILSPRSYRLKLTNILPHAKLDNDALTVTTDFADMKLISIPFRVIKNTGDTNSASFR